MSSVVTSLILTACGDNAPEHAVPAELEAVAETAPAVTNVEEFEAAVPRNPLKDAYFGNLHVHTGWSFDATTNGSKTTPDSAYRWAKGEATSAGRSGLNL